MALNSVKFRIDGDGTSALRAISDVKRGAADLGSTLTSQITSKLKQAFSVYAIMEMSQRTTEWASNLQTTAQKLRLTTDELQEFHAAARKINMDTAEMEGILGTLEGKAQDALKGNAELIYSFKLLKITLEDLRKISTGQLFDKVLKEVRTGGIEGFYGAQEIFGTPVATRLQYVARAKALQDSEQARRGDVQPYYVAAADALQEATSAFVQFKELMVRAKGTFLPFGNLLLNMVNGIIQTVMALLQGVKLSVMTGLTLIGTIFGIKGSKEKFFDNWTKSAKSYQAMGPALYNAAAGMTNFGNRMLGGQGEVYPIMQRPDYFPEESWDIGHGMTDALIMGLPLSPKGLSAMGRGVRATPGAVGKFVRPSEGALHLGERGLLGRSQRYFNPIEKPKSSLKALQDLGVLAPGTGEIKKLTLTQLGRRWAMKSMRQTPRAAWAAGIGASSAVGSSIGEMAARETEALRGDIPFPGRFPSLGMAGPGSTGPGGGNLKIGGVFGMDVSSKIVQLNTDMLFTMQRMLSIMEANRFGVGHTAPVGLF